MHLMLPFTDELIKNLFFNAFLAKKWTMVLTVVCSNKKFEAFFVVFTVTITGDRNSEGGSEFCVRDLCIM